MNNKRYGVFSCDQYYPLGGNHDFRGRYETLDVAKDHAITAVGDYAWVVDLDSDGLNTVWRRPEKE